MSKGGGGGVGRKGKGILETKLPQRRSHSDPLTALGVNTVHVWGQIIIKPAIDEKTSYQIFDIHLFACSSLTAKFANQGFLAAVIRSEMIFWQCSAKRSALATSTFYIDDSCIFWQFGS